MKLLSAQHIVRAAACAAALLCGACDLREPAQDVAQGADQQWRSELEFQIRLAATSDPDLPEVTHLVVRPDTLLYALHPREKLVRVFNAQGTVLDTLGGTFDSVSFRAPTAMGWADSTLWVYDAEARQFSLFNDHGARVGTVTMPALAGAAAGDSVVLETLLPDKSVLTRVWPAGSDTTSADTITARLVRLQAAPAPPETLLVLRERNPWLHLPTGPGRAPLRLAQPFVERAHIAFSPLDGMTVIVRSIKDANGRPMLQLTKINMPGDTAFSKTLSYEPVRLSSTRFRQEVARIDAVLRQQVQVDSIDPRERERTIAQALYRPRNLPTVTGLVIAMDGSILVRREETGAQEVNWTVLTRGADLVANQATLASTRLLTAGGAFLYGTDRDSTGVPAITRYRTQIR